MKSSRAASGFCRGLPSAEYILQKCVGERQPKLEIREVYRAVHNADACLAVGRAGKGVHLDRHAMGD